MNRLISAALLIAAFGATATSASAAERCRPQHGEHALARSAQAVVLQQTSPARQTITGCSRASGRRRTIVTLRRAGAGDPARLVGLRLAGTRVAYVTQRSDGDPALVADDALHGGRRHDLGASRWPFGSARSTKPAVSWAVDPQGDVAWLTTDHPAAGNGAQAVGVWRPGLGRRQVDAHAALGDLTLRDGVLRWRRDGTPRSVDLAAIAPSRCALPKATDGTLDVDVARTSDGESLTACLRATGKTVTSPAPADADLLDANGPYLLLGSMHAELYLITVVDLVDDTAAQVDGSTGPEAVVDDHGSLAWTNPTGLWVRDAAGTRKVADVPPGAGPLLRDGSTVTVGHGGPSVTLNP